MKSFALAASSAMALAMGLGSGPLAAQFPAGPQLGAPSRPTFSPYLNLTRGGSSAAINYYGIVRPQFQARAAFQSLEQQAAANRQAINDLGAPATGLPDTGHGVAFLNTGGYFMNLNPGRGIGAQGFGGGGGTSFGSQGLTSGGARPAGVGGGGSARFQTPRRR